MSLRSIFSIWQHWLRHSAYPSWETLWYKWHFSEMVSVLSNWPLADCQSEKSEECPLNFGVRPELGETVQWFSNATKHYVMGRNVNSFLISFRSAKIVFDIIFYYVFHTLAEIESLGGGGRGNTSKSADWKCSFIWKQDKSWPSKRALSDNLCAIRYRNYFGSLRLMTVQRKNISLVLDKQASQL